MKLGLGIVVLLLMAAAGYGGYYIEHTRAAATEAGLQSQIHALKKQTASSSGPSMQTTIHSGNPACTAADLTVAKAATNGAAGTTGITYAFTDTSSKACTLNAAPAVTLLHGTDMLGSPATPSTVSDVTLTLQPGAKAYATVLFPNPNNFSAGVCSASAATAIQFMLSGQSTALSTGISSEQYCPGFSVQPFTATAP